MVDYPCNHDDRELQNVFSPENISTISYMKQIFNDPNFETTLRYLMEENPKHYLLLPQFFPDRFNMYDCDNLFVQLASNNCYRMCEWINKNVKFSDRFLIELICLHNNTFDVIIELLNDCDNISTLIRSLTKPDQLQKVVTKFQLNKNDIDNLDNIRVDTLEILYSLV